MTKSKIKYLKGDATNPIGNDHKLITHICNNIGAWGAGFTAAISRKWKQPELQYTSMINKDLGIIDLVKVENDITICNMIAQDGINSYPTTKYLPPIRYVALEHAFKELIDIYNRIYDPNDKFSIHMPKIGSGFAGGNWNIIKCIINQTLCNAGIQVYVYEL